jgi:hypothetical protein
MSRGEMTRRLERKLRWWLLERPRYRLRRRLYQAIVDRFGPLPGGPSELQGEIPRWRFLALDLALGVFPKGRRDCRRHRWYVTLGGQVERCRYCEVGTRAAAPEDSDPWRQAVGWARELIVTDDGFAALVQRVLSAADTLDSAGRAGEAFLLASWLRYAETLASE